MSTLLLVIEDDPVEPAILERMFGADPFLTTPPDVPLPLRTVADPTGRP